MRDTGLDKFLMVFIGIPGLTAGVLAWVQPLDVPERIVITIIGAIGFTWSLLRGLSFRSIAAKQSVGTEEIEKGSWPLK